MTIDTTNQVLTDFLLEVSQTMSYKELAKAYKIISNDFQKIIKNDANAKFTNIISRYETLEEEAKSILQKETNGSDPTPEQRAVFGEMIILRDFCLNRKDSL